MRLDNLLVIANIVIGGLFLTSVGFAIAWLRARERAIRAELRGHSNGESNTQLDRLQQSVESIAIEVERIAEAQRYSARLLTEQKQVAEKPRGAERVITPH